ncbi:hypothetical protein [Gimibacter soli]|uniref:Uncharacterized protein n=1 Tax=Gimibacter soli TaxID=3024400 RepID=A0AAF0BMS9_9PROT|nr:hypothetical protein [Gimibacter soli]WCL54931.1 hypothetical protein PH603_04060 [Gimibacter soli]
MDNEPLGRRPLDISFYIGIALIIGHWIGAVGFQWPWQSWDADKLGSLSDWAQVLATVLLAIYAARLADLRLNRKSRMEQNERKIDLACRLSDELYSMSRSARLHRDPDKLLNELNRCANDIRKHYPIYRQISSESDELFNHKMRKNIEKLFRIINHNRINHWFLTAPPNERGLMWPVLPDPIEPAITEVEQNYRDLMDAIFKLAHDFDCFADHGRPRRSPNEVSEEIARLTTAVDQEPPAPRAR